MTQMPEGGYGDVVNVRAGPRDATVVQDDCIGAEAVGEDAGDVLFAAGAAGLDGLVGGIVGEGEQRSADSWVSFPNAALAVGAASLVLAAGARSRGTGVQIGGMLLVPHRRPTGRRAGTHE